MLRVWRISDLIKRQKVVCMPPKAGPVHASVCESEVERLLACVVRPSFNEHRCLPLLKQLRQCVEREVGAG